VCVRCGSGHASEWLASIGLVRRAMWVRYYRCPRCDAMNYFTDDRPTSE
jgi:phage FluMu protein Com